MEIYFRRGRFSTARILMVWRWEVIFWNRGFRGEVLLLILEEFS